ncbi:MAG: NAD-dependent epimerase/dehydratase family protein [Parcubacteria group bacterium]|nr:NAD-dependent epimerase/dehydratase family protein [Parcubacteria group bacterium]
MPKQKILITGSAGFMGSHIYDRLHDLKKYKVFGVDDLSGGFMRNVSQKKYFTKLYIRSREKTAEYINKLKPDTIFHLAADATEGRSQFTPFSAMDRNLLAYLNLLVPAIKNGVKKIILVSSMSVYGNQQVPFRESMTPAPEDIYGVAKAAMESVTRIMSTVYGFKYVIIRPHNVYGPRQNLSDPYRNVVGIFINRLGQGKNFYIYGDGLQQRAFSYISDVTTAMVKAAFSKKCQNNTINVGSNENVTLNHLKDIILKEFFGKKAPPQFNPEYLPSRPQEVKLAYSSHETMRKLLGNIKQTSLETGLKKTIAWAKTLGPQKFKYLDSLELEHKHIPQTWKKKLY